MTIQKQLIIFVLICVICIFQIFFLNSKNSKLLFFYPKWGVYMDRQNISISTGQGFIAQISPMNNQYDLVSKKQSNSLIVNQSSKNTDKSLKVINYFVKYCNNCFIIDLNHNTVFSEKEPNDDIVLKKKMINEGFSVEKKSVIDLNENVLKLAIFNSISEEMIELNENMATMYLYDIKKEFRLEMSNFSSQKFTFL
jgi:hypothetical protein